MKSGRIHGEMARFLLAGGINTVVSYAVYLAFLKLVSYVLAYSISYALGIVFSYWMQAKWVFRVDFALKKFLVFPMVYLIQYLLGVILLGVLVEYFGVPEWLAPAIVIALTLPVTFIMSRYVMHDGQWHKTHE